MPSACFSAIDKDQRIGNMPKACPYVMAQFGRVRHVMNNWYINQVCSHNNITHVEKNIKFPY